MIKMGMGMMRTSKNQRILKMMKTVDPGTPRKTEEPQGIPMTRSYISNIFTTKVMNEWAMSTIEYNSSTPRVPSSVRAWMESSKHDDNGKSRNMITVHLSREISTIEHRSNNFRQSHKKTPHLSPGKTRRIMKLYSGSIYLLEMMVEIIMIWLIWKEMPKEQ